MKKPAKKRIIKDRLYEVTVPVQEVWVMRVSANNKKQAFLLAESGHGEQICSVSVRKRKIREIK